MKKTTKDTRNRSLAVRGSANTGRVGKVMRNKKLIVITSVLLFAAIFSSVLMFGVLPGGRMSAMAGSSSLSSVSGKNVIPDTYSPVNVGVGTYTMDPDQYKANNGAGIVGTSTDGLAAFDFHIFADRFASSAHTCGNVAVNLLGAEVLGNTGAPEFGSRPAHDVDSTKLSYVGDAYGWASSTAIGKENYQVFGPNVDITGKGQVFIETADGKSVLMGNDNHGSLLDNIYKESEAGSYINVLDELEEAEDYMRWLVWLMNQAKTDTDGVVSGSGMKDQSVRRISYNDILFGGGTGMGWFGWGGTTIDFSDYPEDTIIVDLTTYEAPGFMGGSTLVNEATQLISGMVKLQGTVGKRIIFNVDTTALNGADLTFFDTTMTADKLTNSEDSALKDNNILWNFYRMDNGVPYSYDGKITVGGTWMGTVLAPDATVYCRAGLNGSIIANQVTTTAETHKSDYTGERVISDTVSLMVTKIWEDVPSMRPEFITIQLLRDGKVISSVQVSEANITEDSTDYKWFYIFNDLPAADAAGNTYQYKVKELKVPGYKTQQVNNTIINTSENKEVVPIDYKLNIKKVDEKNKPLAGATLRLTSDSGANLSVVKPADVRGGYTDLKITDKEITWVSTDKPIDIHNLPAGTYTITEISAPAGYKLAASVGVTVDGQTKPVTIVDAPISVDFNKYNSADKNAILPGAEFVLTPNWNTSLSGVEVNGAASVNKSDDGSAITFTTGNSTVSFSKIPAGSYTLTETVVPAGYQQSAPITFIIDAAGSVTVNGNVASSVDMVNYLIPKDPAIYNLTVTKSGEGKDGGTIANLPGAILRLTAANKSVDLSGVTGGTVNNTDKYVEWTTTGSAAVISGLPEGSYVLSEIKAPDGYKKAADVTVNLTGGASNTTVERFASMHDELIRATVSKLDGVSGTFVAGAKLKVTGANFTASWTSDGSAYELVGIPAGEYTLIEEENPAGYTMAANQTFRVDENGGVTYVDANGKTVTGSNVTMYDAPIQVQIIKQYWKAQDDKDTSVDSNETGLLGGAKLTLTPTSGQSLANVTGSIAVTHNADGSISWSSGATANSLRGLPAGKYTLTETEAPAGYEKAAPITFTVGQNGTVADLNSSNRGDKIDGSSVTLTDKKEIYYPLSIDKIDKTSKASIEGATLAIFKEGVTEYTAENAEVVFVSTGAPSQFILPDGKYVLKELEAPKGYDLTEELVHFELKTGGNVSVDKIEGGSSENVVFTFGDVNGLQTQFAGRMSVDITEYIKQYGNPTSVVINAENNAYNIGQIKPVIVASSDGSSFSVPGGFYWEKSGQLGNTITFDYNNGTGSYQKYYLTVTLEGNSGNLLTAEQFSNTGFTGVLKFGDAFTLNIGKGTASDNNGNNNNNGGGNVVSGNGVIALGSASDAIYSGIFTSVGDNNIDGYVYVNITDFINSTTGLPTSVSIPTNVTGNYSISSIQVALVKVNAQNEVTVLRGATAANGSSYSLNANAQYEEGCKYYIPAVVLCSQASNGTFFDADKFANSGINSATLTFSDGSTVTIQNASGGSSSYELRSGSSAASVVVGCPLGLADPNENNNTNWRKFSLEITDSLKNASGNSLSNVAIKFKSGTTNYRIDELYVTFYGYNPNSNSLYDVVGSNNFTTTAVVPNSSAEYTATLQPHDQSKTFQYTEGHRYFINCAFDITDSENSGFSNNTFDQTVLDAMKFDFTSISLSGSTYAITTGTGGSGGSGSGSSGSDTPSSGGLTTGDIVVEQPTNGEPVVIKLPNSKTPEEDLYKYSLKLNKIDKDTKANLSGARFNLYDADGVLIKADNNGNGFYTYNANGGVQVYETVNGYITVNNLPVGSYYLYEVEAPNGYLLNGDRIDITVTKENTSANPAQPTDPDQPDNPVKPFENEARKRTLTINKTDSNGNPLDGARFDLYVAPLQNGAVNYAGAYKVAENILVEDGKLVVTGNALQTNGVYFLKEVDAPDGMLLDSTTCWPALNNATNLSEGNIYFSDAYLYGVALGENIPAKLLQYNYDGNGMPTSAQYKDTTITAYEATISVTNQPVSSEFAKKILGTNTFLPGAVLELRPDNGGATYTSDPVPALSSVYGTAIVNGKEERIPVSDIYQIKYNEDGSVAGMEFEYLTWTTRDSAVTLYGLPEGKYILSEVTAPNGYKTAASIEVNVGEDGSVNGASVVTMFDEPYTGTINLTKVDAKDGTRLADAQFRLKIKETGEYVRRGDTDIFTTGPDGTVPIQNLAWGYTYIFEEISAPYGYTTAGAVITPAEVKLTAENYAEAVNVVAANQRADIGKLILNKTDADAQSSTPISGAQFKLQYRPVGSGSEFVDYNTDGTIYTTNANGTIVVENLPWGNEYEYRFVELESDNGYDYKSLVFTTDSTAVLDKSNGYSFTFNATNRQRTSVTVTKIWEDEDNQDRKRPENIDIRLIAQVNGQTVNTIPGTKTVVDTNTWSYTWSGLDVVDENGNDITYSVDEFAVPDGYVKEISDDGFTITNTYHPGTVSVTVNKHWVDDSNRDGLRPVENGEEYIIIALTGKVGDEVVYTGEQYKLTGTGKNWSKTFYDLDEKYNGETIVYTVDEVSVPNGYTKEISDDGLTITNTHIPVYTGEVSITKEWIDGGNRDNLRPVDDDGNQYVTVTLTGKVGDQVVHTEVVKLTGTGDVWTGKFQNVPQKANGADIVYTVTEDDISGYTKVIEGSVATGFEITNTHQPGVVGFTVNKVWVDDSDRDGLRPESLVVRLVGKVGDLEVSSQNVTLSGTQDTWTHVWNDLPEKNNGQPITYSVEEPVVPDGYTGAVSNTAAIGTITNTYEPATISVSVNKVWDDKNNQDGNRPQSITFTLMNGDEQVRTVTLDVKNGENGCTWEGLDKYQNGGEEITYTVVESAVAGYHAPVVETEKSDDGDVNITVTNSYTPEPTSVTVNKVWNHGTFTGVTPESVTVQLLKNGVAEGEAVTLTAPDWTYTWNNLDKFANGEPVGYSVRENAVPGYSTTVADIDENKIITVTNTRQANGLITLNKIDADDEAPIAGAKFRLEYRLAGTEDAFAVVGEYTTDNAGKIIVPDLNWGYEYKFVEVAPAPGYKLNSEMDESETTVVLNETQRSAVFDVMNARVTTSGVFSKINTATKKELPGATLVITHQGGLSLKNVTAYTGENKTEVPNISENENSFMWVSGTTEVELVGLPAGFYTMTEYTTPYGYVTAETIEFEIRDNGKVYRNGEAVGDDNRIVMYDEPITATISKQEIGGSPEIVGAQLTVTLLTPARSDATLKNTYGSVPVTYDEETNSVTWESTSVANTLSALPDGLYTLEEVLVPTGYDKAETVYFKVEGGVVSNTEKYDGDDTVWKSADDRTVIMYDAISTGSATIAKNETGAGPEVIGAHLTILPVETEVENVSLEDVKGTIEVTYNEEDNSISWISGDKANVITELPDGIYKLTEVLVPDGYTKAEDMYFKVDNGKVFNTTEYKEDDTVWGEVEDGVVLMEDAPLEAAISKQDVGGGPEIPGAQLTVTLLVPENKDANLENVTGTIEVTYDEKNNSVTWVSGEDKNILSRLPDGVYELTEVLAPDCYQLAETMYFRVIDEKVQYSTDYKEDRTVWTDAKEDTVVMEDALTTAVISKQAVGGGPEIPGAQLTVTLLQPDEEGATLEDVTGEIKVAYDEETNSITWISGEDENTLTALPDGIYELAEVLNPAGYGLAEKMYFKVENGIIYNTDKYEKEKTEWDEVDSKTIIMEDAPIEAVVSKKATGGTEELPGAKLTVTLINPAEKGYTLEKTTGTIKVTYDAKTNSVSWVSADKANTLSVLPDGVYTLTETEAPAGYEIAKPVHFKLEKGVVYTTTEYKAAETAWTEAVDSTVVMFDDLSPANGTASFIKKSDLGKPLGGAVFTLTDSTGKTFTATSNVGGVVSFTGLDAGVYKLVETSAPTGYTKSSQEVTVKVSDDGTVAWFTSGGDGITITSVETLFTNTYIIQQGTTPDKPVVGGQIDLSDDLDTSLKDLDVKWESKNPDIADVDQNGVVTIKKPGNFTITVTHNGKPVQNFVLGATDTSNGNNNGGNAPNTGSDLVRIGTYISAAMLGAFGLTAAVVYGVRRRKANSNSAR